MRIQAGLQAVFHQLLRLLALGQGALCHLQLTLDTHPLEVVARHIAGQQHAGGLGVCLGGAALANGRIQRSAVLTKQIELPVARGLQGGNLALTTGYRGGHQAIAGVELAGGVQPGVQLGGAGGIGVVDGGHHTLHPGLGHAQAGVVGQGLVHQLVQLRIAIGFPPLAVQRHAVGGNGLGRQARLLGRHGFGLRKDAGEIGTGGQRREGDGTERKTAPAQRGGSGVGGVRHEGLRYRERWGWQRCRWRL